MRPPDFEVLDGGAREVLGGLPAGSFQTCITSPPYYGLRDYGHGEQLGMEPTLGEYVANLVEVFEQVRRVLRDDGTLWLNLGDSYASRGSSVRTDNRAGYAEGDRARRYTPELKDKDLMGVPWRVAFALQDAGWYLRKEIIWAKPNPTPESVRDRPTSSHETVFLFAKCPRYFYDDQGFREPSVSERPSGNGYQRQEQVSHEGRGMRNAPNRWELADTRNARDVWTIPTVPFPGAHFAVFPPELPRRCIALGSSPRACDRCRAPWVRVLERRRLLDGELVAGTWNTDTRPEAARIKADGLGHGRFNSEARTLGWRPTCACGAPEGVEPGDLDEIATPAGPGGEGDPTVFVGRGGLARPRGPHGGTRPMTRWEQRHIARQLAGSPHLEQMAEEAGRETIAHYLRTDLNGARAVRPALLESWVDREWVRRVEPPAAWWNEDANRCRVLDPFAGAGTTGLVAVDNGRDFVGVELNPEYAEMARDRIGASAQAPRLEFLDG